MWIPRFSRRCIGRKDILYGLTKMKIVLVFVSVLLTIALAEHNHHKRDGSSRNHHQKHHGDARHHGRSHSGNNKHDHQSRNQGRPSHHENRASDSNETSSTAYPISLSTDAPTTQNGTEDVGNSSNPNNAIINPGPPLPPPPQGPPLQIFPFPVPLPEPMRYWILRVMKELGDDYQCLSQIASNLARAIRGYINEPLFPERRVVLIVNDTVVFNVSVHFGLSCSNADQENAPNILGQIEHTFNNLWENLTCSGQIIGNIIREIATLFLRNNGLSSVHVVFKIANNTVYDGVVDFTTPSCSVPVAQPRSFSAKHLAGYAGRKH